MSGETGGLIGGIAGTVIGIIGGIIGTYFSIKNTNSPEERKFVVRASIIMWIAALVFLAVILLVAFKILPDWVWYVVMSVWMIGLGPTIWFWNKKQAGIISSHNSRESDSSITSEKNILNQTEIP